MNIGELGERRLIARIQDTIHSTPTTRLASRDDAFLLVLHGHPDMLVNTDMLVGKTDVPPSMAPYHVGVKCVSMNASDLLVKGVAPEAMVVSLGLPGTMDVEYFDALVNGINDTARKYNIAYIGGDVNEASDLIISITMIGRVGDRLVPRHGIEPGHVLVTTGEFGHTAIGLSILLDRVPVAAPSRYDTCTLAVLEPSIDYRALLDTARMEGVVASIDSSDGLAGSLLDLMAVNDVGFLIDDLPVPDVVARFSAETGIPVVDLLFGGGEEYHGIFAIDPGAWPRVDRDARQDGIMLQRIGQATRGRSISYKEAGTGKVMAITKGGFEHFNPRTSCSP